LYWLTSSVFRDIILCSPLKVKCCNRGTCRLHFQGRGISQARKSAKQVGATTVSTSSPTWCSCMEVNRIAAFYHSRSHRSGRPGTFVPYLTFLRCRDHSACCLFRPHFLPCVFFDPENGGYMFLQNFGSLSTDYTVLYPRKQNCS
jgi:hypothetical protein